MALSSKLRSLLDVTASVVMIAAGCTVIWFGWTGPNISTPRQAAGPSPSSAVEDVEEQELRVRLTQSHSVLPASARVAIIEFSDFECPYCQRFAQETLPELRKELIDKHLVAFGYRHFPIEKIHQAAFDAATAAVCAGEQGHFWQLHDIFFDRRVALKLPAARHAEALKLDSTRFTRCLGSASDAVRADQNEARRLGIGATPTFLVGILLNNQEVRVMRRINGAVPYAVFKSTIDELIKRAS